MQTFRISRPAGRALVIVIHFMMVAVLPFALSAQASAATTSSSQGSVVGTVIDQRTALPVKGANVSLVQNKSVTGKATTDAYGNFTINGVNPGIYQVQIQARDYSPLPPLNVTVASGATVSVNAALIHAQNIANVRTLGTVTVSAGALASATTIRQNVNVQNIAQTGQIRFVDQLETLPAMNVSTSSSPGDDVQVNIRGFGPNETATLLDGRPVGPFGVLAPYYYNYALSPITGLSGLDVTYGSGAQGLYGSDTIAGAVNMHLLNPTATPQYVFQQQVGGWGILSSALDLSGTEGKLGYVAAAGVSGLTGSLNSTIFQSARPANLSPGATNPPYLCSNGYSDPITGNSISGLDVSPCDNAAQSYYVGQQSKVSTLLGKFNYAISGSSALAVSAYDGVQWANSTGNGDNDFLPYATRLGQIQLTSPNCVIGSGTTPNGYTVVTNPAAWKTGGEPSTAPGSGLACYTAQQWANVSYGPDGGGAGRSRSNTLQDYDGKFTTKAGVNNVVLDTYVDNYYFNKYSSLAGGIGPDGSLLGTPVYARNFFTHGYLASDDILGVNNDFGFGYSLLDQLQWSNQLTGVAANPITGEPYYAFQPQYNAAIFREGSWFIRDTHEFGEQWSGFLNAWVKSNNVTEKTTFDPRVSAQYRPDSSDVLRLTYGHSDGPPAPELKSTGPLFQPNPGTSLTSVSCIPGSNTLPTSGGNPNLTSEAANDFELGYGHHFQQDSNIQVNAYVTNVFDQLYTATQPLLDYGLSNVTFAPGALNLYLSRLIAQGCIPAGTTDLTATYPFLGIGTTYNAANELARGIELQGRQRFVSNFYMDYGWFVESSQLFNVPDLILMTNPTLVNGGQQSEIPLHQAQISLDWQPGGFEFRLDNYWMDGNNPIDRPSYSWSNAFVSHSFEQGRYLLTLGGTNIFNQAVQTYGFIGAGVPQRVNQFAPAAPFTGLGQNLAGITSNEMFGLQPAQLSFTFTAKM
jgi:hypothetical protein